MPELYPTELSIATSFVRYQKLGQLIEYSYSGSSCTDINLYIDLNSVLKPLYGDSVRPSVGYDICATVINMCGHYREFFRALGVSTTIYLVYGRNCPTANLTFVEGYNSRAIADYNLKVLTTQQIEINLSMLKILCQYLPKIYFFDIGNCEVHSMIEHIYLSTNADNPKYENIIISRDSLCLQMIPSFNFRVIRPSKTKNGDESIIVDNRNFWDAYITKYRKSNPPNTVRGVSNGLFSNVLAMSNVKDRSIYSKLSLTKTFEILSSAIQSGYLRYGDEYFQSTINQILVMMEIPHNPTELDMRWKAISTHYQTQFIIESENPKLKRLRLIDLEDNNTIKDIVSKHFINNPIDLDRL